MNASPIPRSQEIIEFAKIKEITVICLPLAEEKLEIIRQKMGDYIFGRITFIFVKHDQEIRIKGATIRIFQHNAHMPHLIYLVQINSKSILHVVDAIAHGKYPHNLNFSEDWQRIYDLKPDFLFIGATGHIQRILSRGRRLLIEGSSLTPVQAATLTAKIMPRYVGIIGMYNHSIWDDRYEMGLDAGDAEAQFYWCLSYLAPAINFKKLLPGDVFY